jgi:hypothetical protein
LLTIGRVVQRFSLAPVREHAVKIHAAMTLRPRGGIRLRLAERRSEERIGS